MIALEIVECFFYQTTDLAFSFASTNISFEDLRRCAYDKGIHDDLHEDDGADRAGVYEIGLLV